MTAATVFEVDRAVEEQTEAAIPCAETRIMLGNYMPLAGVRYYAIFGEDDLALGNVKVGVVGWRDPDRVREKKTLKDAEVFANV